MSVSPVDVTVFPVAPLGCNCSILRCRETGEAIVIDPGGDAPKIIAALEESGSKVKWIIHTHAHFDHCLGTHDVAEHCRTVDATVQVGLHPGDNFLYRMLGTQCGWFGLPPVDAREAISHPLEDEERLVFGRMAIEVLHTPGHTPGSCSFCLPSIGLLFSGDTLFAGGIGRTDLPGGDPDMILRSIHNRLLSLDDGTQVVPGHGPFTRIFDEKRTNPFLS